MDFFFQGTDGRVQEFARTFSRVARTDVPVLIVGEPGTGKELVAHALHQRSLRAEEPFLKVDCQLSPKHVLEVQLDQFQTAWPIGEPPPYRASAPVAADAEAPGTIYFHEIAELSLPLQAKVLAVLPEGAGDGAGEARQGSLRPRVVASTNRDLRLEMEHSRFRQDLYFTLAGVRLEIPALRARKDDLAALADHFLRKYCREFGRAERPQLSREALEILCNYDWPGNLPELSSVMKRIVFLGSAEAALAELSRSRAAAPPNSNDPDKGRDRIGLKVVAKEAARRVEREMILQVLRERQWNRKRAASALSISYKTLLSKIKQLGLTDEV